MLALLLLLLLQSPHETTARTLLANFVAGDYEAASKDFNGIMRAALPPARLEAFAGTLNQQVGKFKAVREVKTGTEQGYQVVILVSEFERATLDVRVVLDGDGKVAGLFFKPPGDTPRKAAESRFLDYKTQTRLRLPFDGEWFVFWGGRSLDENYHAVAVDQRFAYDLMIVSDNVSHSGDGRKNTDYYCWDAPIFAPAAGIIVESADGIEDNVPGVMNAEAPPGNHVVIDHGNGEYSLLAHFRKGTVTLKKGDEVQAGQLVGRCGNSGNSSEPHLHYHLQNAPQFGRGEGLPAQFRNYCADGKPVASGEPHRAQKIRRTCE